MLGNVLFLKLQLPHGMTVDVAADVDGDGQPCDMCRVGVDIDGERSRGAT